MLKNAKDGYHRHGRLSGLIAQPGLLASTLALGLLFAVASAGPVLALDCLLDTNNDGDADTNVDTVSGASSAGAPRLACGNNAVATGAKATAIGGGTTATGDNATALGQSAEATTKDATALGRNAQATTSGGVTAVGADATATGVNATALGYTASAGSVLVPTALGMGAQATTNDFVTAVGGVSVATGLGATAVGQAANATTTFATALGHLAQATTNNRVTAVGAEAVATGLNATALGHESKATFAGSTAIGASAETLQDNQLMLGTATSTYTAPGITTPDSATAQTAGGLTMVTADTAGNLATASTVNIDASGNVGLGTPSPNARLHVVSSTAGAGGVTLMVENANAAVVGRDIGVFKNSGDLALTLNNTAAGAATEFWKIASLDGDLRLLTPTTPGAEFSLSNTGSLTITGTLTTGGVTCGGGCDRVFDADYDLPTLDEHANMMWAKGYLPNVGPTPEGQSIDLTDKMGRMLNELEKAHIYIAQLNDEVQSSKNEKAVLLAKMAEQEAELAGLKSHESRLARLEGLLNR